MAKILKQMGFCRMFDATVPPVVATELATL